MQIVLSLEIEVLLQVLSLFTLLHGWPDLCLTSSSKLIRSNTTTAFIFNLLISSGQSDFELMVSLPFIFNLLISA
uniref:Putative secreted protein n=1 Tax=Panstrongylus lignarius TaxID=156445 RepID=A0A224Y484_9HEMI